MITHGNKQISEIVYARKASEGGGAVRLTNIIRGAQVVFGGLYTNIKDWLEKATKAAILAAFGQTDGYAVIKATNTYLNALAATDPTKASALAGFINEDPMMVCSLGLQPQGVTMPIRRAYNNSGAEAAFKLDFYTATDLQFIVKCGYTGDTSGTNDNIIGQMSWNSSWNKSDVGSFSISFDIRSTRRVNYATEHQWYNTWSGTISLNKQYIIDANYTRCLLKDSAGTTLKTQNNTYYWTPGNERLCQMMSRGIIWWEGEVYKAGLLIRKIVPCQSTSQGNGFVDILSGTFYPQTSGTGSISFAYTRNGQPWTPSTP